MSNRSARAWKYIGLGLLFVAISVIVNLEAWTDIYRIASKDEEASHIFLVPIICAWLAYMRRSRIRTCRFKTSFSGPLVVLAGLVVSELGYIFGRQSLWHGGALLMAIGCFVSAVGRDFVVKFFPAFMALIFLIPIPGMIRQQIALPLQSASAHATQFVCELFGVMVDRSGCLLSINGIDVAIAEACNGLRMVFALVLVSFAFAFATPLRGYVRALIILLSPISAVLCNVVRLVPTLLLYGYARKDVADAFHDFSGWMMLVLSFALLMAVTRLLRWALLPVTPYPLAHD